MTTNYYGPSIFETGLGAAIYEKTRREKELAKGKLYADCMNVVNGYNSFISAETVRAELMTLFNSAIDAMSPNRDVRRQDVELVAGMIAKALEQKQNQFDKGRESFKLRLSVDIGHEIDEALKPAKQSKRIEIDKGMER